MPSESLSGVKFEIGHVLFIDIVGYSKLLINQQSEQIQTLKQNSQWRSLLHELGECEVKHGLRISLLNLYGGEAGNPELPEKYRQAKAKRQTAPGAAPAKSVAVLPFVNMSADRNDEYLSDGMTEELINALARVPGLRVPGRSSSFAFKGKNEDDIFRKVGEQL